MLSMLLGAQFCIRFVIGEKIILGTGVRLLRIVGEFRGMFMITGIYMMQDVLGKIFRQLIPLGETNNG
jgi:hypothetical protein